jgi:Uma2 family endonuclease
MIFMPIDTTSQIEPSHILLPGISWSTYESILNELEDRRRFRVTYDEGELEIITISEAHERIKKLIARMIEAFTEEMAIPIRSSGSTTFKQKLLERGLEPDECYYVQREVHVRGCEEIDFDRDPAPDLAIEVDVSRSCLDRLPIYASLGFAEVWRYTSGLIEIYLLEQDGTYRRSDRSRALPLFDVEKLSEFMLQRNDVDETTLIRSFRGWVRSLGG